MPVDKLSASGASTMSPAMERADNYARWIVNIFYPYFGSSILEIGSGHGNFNRLFPAASKQLSVDIDTDAVAMARKKYPSKRFMVGDVGSGSFPESVGGEKFSSVLCINVLEHVHDDSRAVRNMLDVLSPGGHLLLLVPAHVALYNDIDKMAGHLRRYDKKSLESLLSGTASQIVKLEYMNPIGGIGWWLNRFLSHKDISSGNISFQVMLFDKVILPVSKVAGLLTRGFFGQSLVCIARKQ